MDFPRFWGLCAWILGCGYLAAITRPVGATDPPLSSPAAQLKTIFLLQSPEGARRFTLRPPGPDGDPPGVTRMPLFRGIVSEVWPEGLIPIYAVGREGMEELRRQPPSGQEGITEPLCFALPPEEEWDPSLPNGRWEVVGTHADGHEERFGWELAVVKDQVFGRFDPLTDYRFAYITEGTYQSNELRLTVEYIDNRYAVTGRWESGVLAGAWSKSDGSTQGRWRAERSPNYRLRYPDEEARPLRGIKIGGEGPVRYEWGPGAVGEVLGRLWPLRLEP